MADNWGQWLPLPPQCHVSSSVFSKLKGNLFNRNESEESVLLCTQNTTGIEKVYRNECLMQCFVRLFTTHTHTTLVFDVLCNGTI